MSAQGAASCRWRDPAGAGAHGRATQQRATRPPRACAAGPFGCGPPIRVARPPRRAGGFRRNKRPRHSRCSQDDLSAIVRHAPANRDGWNRRLNRGAAVNNEPAWRGLLSLTRPGRCCAHGRATQQCAAGPPGHARPIRAADGVQSCRRRESSDGPVLLPCKILAWRAEV